eukprot:TRINITY_DN6231_c0_g1_i2.p1 TRINITY_DN6231_c0_g1~~TRINITY_DN6231_c0_g1_i2.p1  ORF type:complete len:134 (+),score=24.60 TRINITY_DN6231_c0_g1_i2:141-542(+)
MPSSVSGYLFHSRVSKMAGKLLDVKNNPLLSSQKERDTNDTQGICICCRQKLAIRRSSKLLYGGFMARKLIYLMKQLKFKFLFQTQSSKILCDDTAIQTNVQKLELDYELIHVDLPVSIIYLGKSNESMEYYK